MPRPVLVVHGGAWDIPKEKRAPLTEGCELAALAGWAALDNGGSALDAVEAAVRALEEDPRFNAGRGAAMTRAGTVEVDASLMAGDGRAGAVAAVPEFLHPITLARRVLEAGENVLLVGSGALAFAREHGMEPEPAGTLGRVDTEVTTSSPGDTVGAVALDRDGILAAATSTGGTRGKRPGRVGDSPILGGGTWADQRGGAASATGHGESIMRTLMTREAVDFIRSGLDAADAAREAIAELARRTGGRAGIIVVDHNGKIGLAHNTLGMSFAVAERGEISRSGTSAIG